MADTQLYLGLDLGPEYTQLSYYNVDTREVESVYHDEAKDTYMLPNVMFYSAYHKRSGEVKNDCYRFVDLSGWCVGAKASAYRFEDNGTIIDGIYEKTLLGKAIEVEGKTYKASELLVKLLILHIKQFTDRIGDFTIKGLTVTISDTNPKLIQAVKGLKNSLKLSHEQFSVVSHLDSGLCYIFAQPEPLRNNSVGLFDFKREGLDFYRIDMTRKYPLIVTTKHVDYHDRMNMSWFGRYQEDMDEAFADIVKECMSEVFISSVYLTGIGFAENWMKQSAAALCQGRRVFVGQNIYTKGACYRALGGVYTEALERYFIDTEHTVKTNIGISLTDDRHTFYPIAYGGLEWFNTRGEITFFLDKTRRIQIVYQDILTEEKLCETVEIYGLPARPNKTTKLSIEVMYYGAEKGAIVIRDLGFGKLYPSTNKIYRKEFDLATLRKRQAIKLQKEQEQARAAVLEGDTDELRGEAPTKVTKDIHTEASDSYDTAMDSLKQDIHQDLDDLRLKGDDVPDANVVYYGTAAPAPSAEPDSAFDEEPDTDDDSAFGDVEPDSMAGSSAFVDEEPDDMAGNSAFEEDAESDYMTGNSAFDEEDDDEEEEDEAEGNSAFAIPSYLRGQNFDPGE